MMLFNKKEMIEFAKFVYGVEIDCLQPEEKYQCKTYTGALEYWIANKRTPTSDNTDCTAPQDKPASPKSPDGDFAQS